MTQKKVFSSLVFGLAMFFYALPLQGVAQHNTKLVIAATATGFADSLSVGLYAASNPSFQAPQTTIVNGTFTIEATLPQPDMYILAVGDLSKPQTAKQYQVFLDNEVIEIGLNANAPEVQIISGKTPNAFADLVGTFGSHFEKLSNLASKRQAASNDGYYSDSLTKLWDNELSAIQQAIPAYLTKHDQTAVPSFLLNTVWTLYNDVAMMDNWISQLSARGKNTPFYTALENQMKTERLFGYGAQAPDFVQNDPQGKPVSLKDFRGQYVLVDFWASWCGPCRQENPNLVRAFNRFKNKNFTVLGVSLDKEKPKWLKAISDDQLTWPHVSDLKFWQNDVAQLYMVSSIPQNFLLDPEGKIIGKNLRGIALDDFLEKTLGNN